MSFNESDRGARRRALLDAVSGDADRSQSTAEPTSVRGSTDATRGDGYGPDASRDACWRCTDCEESFDSHHDECPRCAGPVLDASATY